MICPGYCPAKTSTSLGQVLELRYRGLRTFRTTTLRGLAPISWKSSITIKIFESSTCLEFLRGFQLRLKPSPRYVDQVHVIRGDVQVVTPDIAVSESASIDGITDGFLIKTSSTSVWPTQSPSFSITSAHFTFSRRPFADTPQKCPLVGWTRGSFASSRNSTLSNQQLLHTTLPSDLQGRHRRTCGRRVPCCDRALGAQRRTPRSCRCVRAGCRGRRACAALFFIW